MYKQRLERCQLYVYIKIPKSKLQLEGSGPSKPLGALVHRLATIIHSSHRETHWVKRNTPVEDMMDRGILLAGCQDMLTACTSSGLNGVNYMSI